MSETTSPVSSTARYRPETRLVHSGTLRSQFGETSEALFLTSSFVQPDAATAAARAAADGEGRSEAQHRAGAMKAVTFAPVSEEAW